MARKKGICRNTAGCYLAHQGKIQEADASDFICKNPLCKQPLYEITKKTPITWKYIVIAIILIGCCIGIYCLLSNGDEDPGHAKPSDPKINLELNKYEMSLVEGGNDTLVATIQSESELPMDAIVTFESNNDQVAGVFQIMNTYGDVSEEKTRSEKAIVYLNDFGDAEITVLVLKGQDTLASSKCYVSIEKKDSPTDPAESEIPADPPKISTPGRESKYDLGWGVYVGPLSNGMPDGTGGKIHVKEKHRIKTQDVMGLSFDVLPGETIIDTRFENGSLCSGVICHKNGERDHPILVK